jgi:N-acetylneuraminate synthase
MISTSTWTTSSPRSCPIGSPPHLPDLFAGDFLVDLASDDEEIWERSIREVQRTIDVTRNLRTWFTVEEDPIMVSPWAGSRRTSTSPRGARTSTPASPPR